MDDRMFHITDIELAALNETKRVESEHILQALQDSEESEAVCGSAANSENIDNDETNSDNIAVDDSCIESEVDLTAM